MSLNQNYESIFLVNDTTLKAVCIKNTYTVLRAMMTRELNYSFIWSQSAH
jgi:hypothetical protein